MFQLLKMILYTIYNHSTPRTEDEVEIKIRRITNFTNTGRNLFQDELFC